jgi:hypothetical protein
MMRRDTHTIVVDDPCDPYEAPTSPEQEARRRAVLAEWFNSDRFAKARKDGRITIIGPITVRE